MQNIKIDNTGISIKQSGKTVMYDKNTTLEDYLPNIQGNSSWTGILNKGDILDVNMSKLIFLRARLNDNSDVVSGCSITNMENYCSPAHNTIVSSCGCCSNSSGGDTLLNFEMNSYTNYKLDEKVLFLNSEKTFDCSTGIETINIATDWTGCTLLEGGSCSVDPLENTVTFQGTAALTCDLVSEIPFEGIYKYVFTGVLENLGIVLKTNSAQCDYVCQKDYYAYIKEGNEKMLIVFENLLGKWVIVRLSNDISNIIEKNESFEVLEMSEIQDYTKTINFNDSGIMIPQNNADTLDLEYFENTGEKNILDNTNNIKISNLFFIESDRFNGKITSKMDNVKLSINISH